MSKAPSPLLGYNNNVRHKNRVFHIQTEDSGVKYGHIITHLFMDGGRILKSVKTSYSEYLGNDKMADIVREMMKQQHKAMFIALRDGKFDHLVEGVADVSQQTKALAVESAAQKLAAAKEKAVAPPAPSVPDTTTGPVAAVVAPPPVAAAAAAPPPAPAPLPPPPPAPAEARSTTPTTVNPVPRITPARSDTGKRPSVSPPSTAARRAASDDDAPQTERTPPEELTLDIEALERAAAVADAATASFKPASDLPPPPTNLFREKTATGSYRSLSQPPPPAAPAQPPPARPPSGKAPVAPAVAPPPPKPVPAAAAAAAASERRYAPTRPASIFGQARPQQGKTIFGEDLISDKSLDEVILSYLADDLDPPADKK